MRLYNALSHFIIGLSVSVALSAPAQAADAVEIFVKEASEVLIQARRDAKDGEDWTKPFVEAGSKETASNRDLMMAGLAQGMLSMSQENQAEACRYFKRAAENGSAAGMHSLGECYYHGSLTDNRGENIIKWYQRAAENGSHTSLCALGELLIDGVFIESDPATGYKFCAQAAALGSDGAKLTIAQGLIQSGQEEHAIKYLTPLIEAENRQAGFYLGVLVIRGDYIPKNMEERAQIAELAGAGNRKEAIRLAADIYSQEVLRDQKTAPEKVNGPYGYKTYYWNILTVATTDDPKHKELAKSRIEAIYAIIDRAKAEEWYELAISRAEERQG